MRATESSEDDETNEASDDADANALADSRVDDDPDSVPSASLTGWKGVPTRERGNSDPTVDAALTDPGERSVHDVRAIRTAAVSVAPVATVHENTAPAPSQLVGTDESPVAASGGSAAPTIDPAVPSPTDQFTTEYGDIGKWMLQSNGELADYGGLPYDGKTVLEPVNVIIVDPTSRTALEATWKLNVAMRRSGFPPRAIHSTGFRGLIDGLPYRQQPRSLLLGYSDNSFLLTNNHGRIFGPDPVETSSGYVWSGAFSTEEFVFYQGLPRHAYVSSNMARDALAGQLVAGGRATLGDPVSLDNMYDTESTTTGDHDGYAVVVILNARGVGGTAMNAAMLGDGTATSTRSCVAASSPTPSDTGACATVVLAIDPDFSSGR